MQSAPTSGFCKGEPGARTALGFLEGREQERGCVGVEMVLGGSLVAGEAGSGMLVDQQSGKHTPMGSGGRRGS